MKRAAYLSVVFLGTSVIPAIGYHNHGFTGLFLGYIISIAIQFAAMGVLIKYISTQGGTVASVNTIFTILMAGIILGAISLGMAVYSRNKSVGGLALGIVLGALITLMSQSLAVKAADNVFVKN